ncbi:hypothetical protein B9G55_01420 [Saccharibacillus sp. O16]|nr:hypothetical protein B9G55_01420 [Saccharibacillus sp. O16]
MPIKLKWAYEEDGVRHEAGETVTLSAAEEKWLIAGRYAVRVQEAQEVFEEEAQPEGPEDSEPEASKKKGASRKGAADSEA